MGHKISPKSFRISFNKDWLSRWFSAKKYKELLEEGVSQKEISDKIDTMWFSAKRTKQTSHDLASTMTYAELYPDEHALHGPYPDIYNYRRTYTSEEMFAVLKKYITIGTHFVALNGKGVEKFAK